MIKKITIALSVVLALIFAAIMPMSVFAEAKPVYISEFKITYGPEGKTQLKDAGYTVVEGNLNEGSTKKDEKTPLESVWIGYKTTEDKSEAITDISVMNMKGNYSFVDYAAMLSKQNQEVTSLINGFETAIKELRKNFQAKSEAAVLAVKMLNMYYEDDSKTPFGDFLMDPEKSTPDNLVKVFMEGNMQYISKVEQIIAIGLTEKGETLVDRLAKASLSDEYDGDLAETNSYLVEEIKDFQSNLEQYDYFGIEEKVIEKYGENYSLTEFVEYIYDEDNNLPDTAVNVLQETASLIAMAKEIKYSNTPNLTLYSIISINYRSLSDTVLNPLSYSMTEGQRAALPTAGLATIIASAVNVGKCLSDMEEAFTETASEVTEAVSIYTGVDRSLFSDPDSVALTSEAHTESGSSEKLSWENTWEKQDYEFKYVRLGAIIGAAVSMAVGVGVLGVALSKLPSVTYRLSRLETLRGAMGFIDKDISKCETLLSRLKFFKYAGVAVIVITAVVASVIAGLELYNYIKARKAAYQQYVDSTYEHEAKPRVIVDTVDKDGQTVFVNYYAVKNLNESAADINGTDTGADGKSFNYEWNVIYTTKDTAAGNPIRAEGFKMIITNQAQTNKKYVPVHDFEKGAEGVKTAANLNKGTANEAQGNYKPLYAYYQNSEILGTLAGTSFTEGSAVLFCAVSFAAGCGIMFIVMMAVNSKKKKETLA